MHDIYDCQRHMKFLDLNQDMSFPAACLQITTNTDIERRGNVEEFVLFSRLSHLMSTHNRAPFEADHINTGQLSSITSFP